MTGTAYINANPWFSVSVSPGQTLIYSLSHAELRLVHWSQQLGLHLQQEAATCGSDEQRTAPSSQKPSEALVWCRVLKQYTSGEIVDCMENPSSFVVASSVVLVLFILLYSHFKRDQPCLIWDYESLTSNGLFASVCKMSSVFPLSVSLPFDYPLIVNKLYVAIMGVPLCGDGNHFEREGVLFFLFFKPYLNW
jgi:hypothetical protein